MRVSLTLDMRNPMGRPWRDHWEDCLWFLSQAEPLGFFSVMVQEHFFTEDGYAPSVPIFLTELIRRTETIRVGAWAYVLPLHNPAHLAQETAVLDQLSGGRLEVVAAAGHSAAEYRAFGLDPSSRADRMNEGLDVLTGCWTKDEFSYNGRHHHLERVTVQPRPLQQPHPTLWVASTAVPSARRAGRYGAHLAAATIDPSVFDEYRRARQAAGHDPAAARISVPMSVTVTDQDPELVWERNRELYHERYKFYAEIRSEIGDEELHLGAAGTSHDAFRENEMIGNPSAIIDVIRGLASATGATDLVLTGPAAGIPLRGEAYESLRRFSSEVLPLITAI